MSNWKYATIRKGTHLHGRITMQLHVNKKEQTVTVELRKAQEINAQPSPDQKNGLNVHCRVQIHQQCSSATDAAEVYDSLFTMADVEDSRLKRKTARHSATNTPIFNESFIFPLNDKWGDALGGLRLYVALVADEVVCSDGTGCIGCMSISLNDIVNKKGQWPDEFWLLSQTEGLYSYEDVKREVTLDNENATLTHVVVKGRVRANLAINGTYFCQGTKMYNKRYLYKHNKNGLWMSFHKGRNCWTISDQPGSNAPIAYIDDDSATPDQASEKNNNANPTSNKYWMVFSRERRFIDGGDADNDARFEPDELVSVSVADASDLINNVQNEDAPAFDASIIDQGRVSIAAKVKQANYFAGRTADPLLVPAPLPLSDKAKNIVRLIASEQQFLETLRNLNIIRMTLLPERDQKAFAVIPQLLNACQLVLEELRVAQSRDPNLDRPIGLLFVDIFPVIAEPMLDYCTALDIKVSQVTKSLTSLIGQSLEMPEVTRDALSALGGINGVINKIPCAFMQVQRYPLFILAIQKSAIPNDKDQGPLFIAWQKYKDLAQQAVKIAGKLEMNEKEKPKPNQLPPPLVSTPTDSDDNFMKYPYYHGEIPRAKVIELYQAKPENGWFLVRKLAGQDKYFLSYGAEGRLVHQEIQTSEDGKCVLGQEFTDLNGLVVYYSTPRTSLNGAITKPCIRT